MHLNAKTSSLYKVLRSRGVEQRNTALSWIREHCKDVQSTEKPECHRGVLYFMDDDNKYDRRLFKEVRFVMCTCPRTHTLSNHNPTCESAMFIFWP